jgi:hypothetical protein
MAIPGKDALTLFLRTKPLTLLLCHWRRTRTDALAPVFMSWLRRADFGGDVGRGRAQELVLLPKQDALAGRAPVALRGPAAAGGRWSPCAVARAFPVSQADVCAAAAAALAAAALGVPGAAPPPAHEVQDARRMLAAQRKRARTARKADKRTAQRAQERAAAAAAAGGAAGGASASSFSSSDDDSDASDDTSGAA